MVSTRGGMLILASVSLFFWLVLLGEPPILDACAGAERAARGRAAARAAGARALRLDCRAAFGVALCLARLPPPRRRIQHRGSPAAARAAPGAGRADLGCLLRSAARVQPRRPARCC
jgi:hypothetical protein